MDLIKSTKHKVQIYSDGYMYIFHYNLENGISRCLKNISFNRLAELYTLKDKENPKLTHKLHKNHYFDQIVKVIKCYAKIKEKTMSSSTNSVEIFGDVVV